jgi:transcriptional regulator with PAS, ATPase and Fis domain
VSRELIESRLFGHHKGAFTGADRDHRGVIRAAHGGTLLLDEIGDLGLEAQGALLRFLQSGEIQPVGASRPVNVDVRVVASTNRNLRQDVESGRFRSDLFYRLSVTSLSVPPLRVRTGDILPLVRMFTSRVSRQYGLPEPELSKQETAALYEYEWPGNVRELENWVKRRVLFGPDAGLPGDQESWTAWDAAVPGSGVVDSPGRWSDLTAADRLNKILFALESANGNVTRAAQSLRISRRTVQRYKRHRPAKDPD